MHDNKPPQGQKTLSELLDEKEQRASAATPGPWGFEPLARLPEDYYLEDLCIAQDGGIVLASISAPNRRTYQEAKANNNFIAAARTDVPALVKALRRAVEMIVEEEDYSGRRVRLFAELAKLLREPADSTQSLGEPGGV